MWTEDMREQMSEHDYKEKCIQLDECPGCKSEQMGCGRIAANYYCRRCNKVFCKRCIGFKNTCRVPRYCPKCGAGEWYGREGTKQKDFFLSCLTLEYLDIYNDKAGKDKIQDLEKRVKELEALQVLESEGE